MNYTKIAKIFAKTLIQEAGDCFARVATLARNDSTCHSEPALSRHSEVATEESRGITTRLFHGILRFAQDDRIGTHSDSVFGRARDFVKYHNAFTVILVVAIVLTGSAMASEPAREMLAEIVGEEIVIEKGIDNSQLLLANLENFDTNLKIDNVLEDEENYYIDYSFNTIAVKDNIWQPIIKLEKFTVNKQGLGNRDLGLYLIEELGEEANEEIIYLKESQKTEAKKGATLVVKTTKYTGLIGLVLSKKDDVLPDYEPVVQPVVQPAVSLRASESQRASEAIPSAPTPPAPDPISGCMNSTALNYNAEATQDDGTCEYSPAEPLVCESFTYSDYTECAEDGTQTRTVLTSLPDGCVDGNPIISQSCEYISDPSVDSPADVCDTDHITLCNTQELCEGIELFWHSDESCHCEEQTAVSDEAIPEPDPDPVCDADHIDLCNTQELCEEISLFWYNDTCNLEAETPAEPEPILGCIDEIATNYNPEATQDDGTCEYPPPTCESFTYSDYTECQESGTQTRTVLTSSPEACVDGNPILSQPCDYIPDPDPDLEE